MAFLLSYVRPDRVEKATRSPSTLQDSFQQSVRVNSTANIKGIPDSLSLDRIINGQTCPVSASFSR